MLTHLAIEDSLIKDACQFSDQLTANEVASQALHEYIQHRKQLKLLDLFGTVGYHDSNNPKEQRKFKT